MKHEKRREDSNLTIEEFYKMLKKSREAKGYFFNKTLDRTFELLKVLLINNERYGYMGCPFRLLAGDLENDRGIFCPCTYREPDVRKFGSCYFNPCVSEEWNNGEIPRVYVPERRPPEKYKI